MAAGILWHGLVVPVGRCVGLGQPLPMSLPYPLIFILAFFAFVPGLVCQPILGGNIELWINVGEVWHVWSACDVVGIHGIQDGGFHPTPNPVDWAKSFLNAIVPLWCFLNLHVEWVGNHSVKCFPGVLTPSSQLSLSSICFPLFFLFPSHLSTQPSINELSFKTITYVLEWCVFRLTHEWIGIIATDS